MKSNKIQLLSLAFLMLFTNSIYATTTNNLEISSKYNDNSRRTKASSSQTLADTDGDGYFAVKIPSSTAKGNFSLSNHGSIRVDVIVYSATTGNTVWSARVNPGKSATSALNLSLAADKYCFEVVSDDGSALNVTCSARY